MHNIVLPQTRSICFLVTVYLPCVGYAIHFSCDIVYPIAEFHSSSENSSHLCDPVAVIMD